MLWPCPLGPEGARVQTRAAFSRWAEMEGLSRWLPSVSRLYHLCGTCAVALPPSGMFAVGASHSQRTAGSVLCRQQQEAGEWPAHQPRVAPAVAGRPAPPRCQGPMPSPSPTCGQPPAGSLQDQFFPCLLDDKSSQECVKRQSVARVCTRQGQVCFLAGKLLEILIRLVGRVVWEFVVSTVLDISSVRECLQPEVHVGTAGTGSRSSLWLSIPLCVYTACSFFIHPSADGHLGCFYLSVGLAKKLIHTIA